MYADSLSRIADGAAKTDGIALGEQAAALIQSDRATDLTNAPDTYRPITARRCFRNTLRPSRGG
jgi:hypothetical protein